jgi:hypothetical protein
LSFLISYGARRRRFPSLLFTRRSFLSRKKKIENIFSLFMLVQLIMFLRFLCFIHVDSSKTTASFHWSFLILFVNINVDVCACLFNSSCLQTCCNQVLNLGFFGCRKTEKVRLENKSLGVTRRVWVESEICCEVDYRVKPITW